MTPTYSTNLIRSKQKILNCDLLILLVESTEPMTLANSIKLLLVGYMLPICVDCNHVFNIYSDEEIWPALWLR